MKFTEQLRAFDDADLDVYQYRLLTHYWRVGTCWETVRTTAEKCKMSAGKVSQVKKWLLSNGWIKEIATDNGRIAVELCSPDEQNVHEMNKTFTTRTECSPHEQNPVAVVHHVNAILNRPNILNEPKLNRPIEEPPLTPPTGGENDYLVAVWPLVLDTFGGDTERSRDVLKAQALFADVSGRKQPYVNGDQRQNRAVARDWWVPLDEMLGECEGDFDLLNQGLTAVFAAGDRDGLTLPAPKSTVKMLGATVAKIRRGGNQPPPQQKQDDQLANLYAMRDAALARQ